MGCRGQRPPTPSYGVGRPNPAKLLGKIETGFATPTVRKKVITPDARSAQRAARSALNQSNKLKFRVNPNWGQYAPSTLFFTSTRFYLDRCILCLTVSAAARTVRIVADGGDIC